MSTVRRMPLKPNILLLVADQHRFDAVGCYDNPDIITPLPRRDGR